MLAYGIDCSRFAEPRDLCAAGSLRVSDARSIGWSTVRSSLRCGPAHIEVEVTSTDGRRLPLLGLSGRICDGGFVPSAEVWR